jgi:hypothetical protein
VSAHPDQLAGVHAKPEFAARSGVIYRAEDRDAYIERHEMPNGSVVFYKDGTDLAANVGHTYWREHRGELSCSGRLAGISTVSKCDGQTDNDGLLDWAARLAYEGVAREASLGLACDPEDAQDALAWLESADSIRSTMEASKTTWRDIRAEKGRIGTDSHEILERLTDVDPDVAVLPTTGYDRAVLAWWQENTPTPLHAEVVVYSAEHGFAGRFDLLAEIGGKRVLLDLKTSNWISASFAIQLNLYRLAGIESGVFDDVDRLVVLHVDDQGNYNPVEVPIRPQWALNALASYMDGKETGQWARAAGKPRPRPTTTAVAA